MSSYNIIDHIKNDLKDTGGMEIDDRTLFIIASLMSRERLRLHPEEKEQIKEAIRSNNYQKTIVTSEV